MKKLRAILAHKYGTLVYLVLLLLLKWHHDVNGFPASIEPYIFFAWELLKGFLVAALAHILLIIILALIIGTPEKEWWEQKKLSKGNRIYMVLTKGVDVSAPILVLGGLVWIVAVLTLKTVLILVIGFFLRLCIDTIITLVKQRKNRTI